MTVEYKDGDGFYIIRLSERYYYGDGKTINAFGLYANQFLRFHPYMDYVGDRIETVPQDIRTWIEKNV